MPNNFSHLKQTSIAYTLQQCQLFSELPTEELDLIAGFTVIKALKKADYLFREGDDSHGFFIVQRGAVSVHRVNAIGREQVIHIFRDGESFAEGSLATAKGYPADARALEHSKILMVQRNDFVDLLGKRPDLALRILASMALHLRDLVGQIEDLTLRDVETRLKGWLIKRCPEPNSNEPYSFNLTSTKQDLAAEIGTASATLSRTLGHLRDQSLIEVAGKLITVTSPAKLTAMLRAQLGD